MLKLFDRSTLIEHCKKVKFIVSDMDGTLLGEDHTVLEANRLAVEQLRKQGIRFTIATGRVDYMVAEFVRQLNIDEPVVSCNGAMVRNLNSGLTLASNPIDPNDAREILQYFNALDFDILAYETDRVCHASNSVRVEFFRHYNELARQGGSEEIKLVAFDKVSETFYEGQEYLKLFIWQPNQEKLQAAAKHLETRYPNLYFVQSTGGSLDITAKGTTKGTAIEALAAYTGYEPHEFAVFGDQNNDVAMFRVAGVSFAMENASPLARENADWIAPHHQDNGFAQIISEYFLE